ncbi:MAG: helix-turn-helix transcriptional regulator [Humibacillus sp.]|nr:helix-turn-helix transcriptional regulator [Humibacillus sp.]MDN5777808.1 helix-turn-helix transcriptional regulator [Humibacillus sp.]
MDNGGEVREFLASRRARLTPEQAGLGAARGHRRVAGLRRGEVADLAGVSVEYYSRLERGNLRGASHEVLKAVARALQLDEAEHAHLFDLARAAGPALRTRRRPGRPQISGHLQHLLDAMTGAPAFVRNGRLDVLAANPLARALYSPVFDRQPEPVNLARFCFLDPRSASFYPDWDDAANTTVALLGTEAGRDPYDRDLTALIGEMSTRSDDFRTRWAAHEVRLHRSGTKHFSHPVVGRLDLPFEAFAVSSDSRLTLTAYTAAPGSPSADNLSLLASWAATQAAGDTNHHLTSAPDPS